VNNDVTPDNQSGRKHVKFIGPDGERHARKWQDELNIALERWDALLEIGP
jgi:hypothetical protein